MMNMQKNINAKYAGKIYLWVIQCRDKGDKSWKINMPCFLYLQQKTTRVIIYI